MQGARLAVDEAERAKDRAWASTRLRTRVEGRPRVHDLDPETASWITETLSGPANQRAMRVAAAAGPASSLPPDLARLVPIEDGDPASADVLLICPQVEDEEHLGPDLSALARACAAVVESARVGQILIMTSASYVGCTRDLLVEPLQRRGLRVGRDVQVAVSPEPIPGGSQSAGRIIGGATPACAATAAIVLGALGPVVGSATLEEAEAAALTSQGRSGMGVVAKRVLDMVGAAVGLVLLAPSMLLVSLLIRMDSRGPIFFSQERVGLNGRRFRVRKFRTMTDDAELRLNEVLHLNGISGPAFQIDHDPRVTRVGRFLRASSLDEVPQLWNVIRGEMSLVGPRPAPIVEVSSYKPWHLRRLATKPGITGLAQVRARTYREFDEKAGLDLQYIDHWSIWLDVRILLETIPAVLRFTGR